jgi:hypothetical protein
MTPLIDPADPRARSDGGTSPSPAADDADDADDDDESDESDESDGDG